MIARALALLPTLSFKDMAVEVQCLETMRKCQERGDIDATDAMEEEPLMSDDAADPKLWAGDGR